MKDYCVLFCERGSVKVSNRQDVAKLGLDKSLEFFLS